MGFQEISINGLNFYKPLLSGMHNIFSLTSYIKAPEIFHILPLKVIVCLTSVFSLKFGNIYEHFLGRKNKGSLSDIMVACSET